MIVSMRTIGPMTTMIILVRIDIPYSDWRDMPKMPEEVMCYLDNDRHSDE